MTLQTSNLRVWNRVFCHMWKIFRFMLTKSNSIVPNHLSNIFCFLKILLYTRFDCTTLSHKMVLSLKCFSVLSFPLKCVPFITVKLGISELFHFWGAKKFINARLFTISMVICVRNGVLRNTKSSQSSINLFTNARFDCTI